MKLNDQVLSDSQMRLLVNLGLDVSDASVYCKNNKLLWKSGNKKLYSGTWFIYTLGDIVKKLPKEIKLDGYEFQLVISPGKGVMYFDWIEGRTLVEYRKLSWQSDIDTLFECLKWCLMNRHI